MTAVNALRSAPRWGLLVVTALAAAGVGYLTWASQPGWGDVALYALCLGGVAIWGPFGALVIFMSILFTRVTDFFPGLSELSPAKVAGAVAVVGFGASKVLRRDFSWVRSPFNLWVIVLFGMVFVSVFFSTDPAASRSFFADVIVKLAIIWLLMINLIDSRRRAIAFQLVVAVLTVGLAVYTIVATVAGLVDGTGRAGLIGLLGNPNDLAYTLLMAFPFLVEAGLRHRGPMRLVYFGGALALLGAISLTQSRGAVLALGAAAFLMLRARYQSRLFVVMGAALVAGALLLVGGVSQRATFVLETDAYTGQRTYIDESSRGRLDAWRAGARMMYYHPLTGVGLDQVTANYGAYAIDPTSWRPVTSHNSFVQVGAETGLIGLLAFSMLTLLSLVGNRYLLSAEPPERASPLEVAVMRAQLPNFVAVFVAASFLSVGWYWFTFIIFAQAATAARIWTPEHRLRLVELLPRAIRYNRALPYGA